MRIDRAQLAVGSPFLGCAQAAASNRLEFRFFLAQNQIGAPAEDNLTTACYVVLRVFEASSIGLVGIFHAVTSLLHPFIIDSIRV